MSVRRLKLLTNSAIGDFAYRLPNIYTELVFMNSQPNTTFSRISRSMWMYNLTPPYVNNHPDVQHVRLKANDDGSHDVYLVMCSDGLVDLHTTGRSIGEAARHWMKIIERGKGESNLALALLRDALGGDNEANVSRMMTVEMSESWMDDTTIIVQYL